MAINDQPELLFFDTFSHDSSEELNLDLVQFPKSVFVREIRVIPLGARVQGDFPGGVRLGATNPTQFHIDFFVNDLSKPGASTFESLGSLDYSQNGQIHMECINSIEKPRIPTDGLVLKGLYTTITLAVYGNLTQVIGSPGSNQPQVVRPSITRAVTPVQANIQQNQDWNPEPPTQIPSYTGNIATTNPEVYGTGAYVPDGYDNQVYRNEYYENEPPKDPRTYHMDDNEWEKDRPETSERDGDRIRVSPHIDHERDRERREGRGRRPSLDRRSRESSRHRDRSRDRRSRSREYIVKGEYRPLSRSPSRSVDRMRGMSSERDWDRGSYNKDDYRRRRDSSYERSRAGSYDKRSGSYERHSPPYDVQGTSYERKSYEKRSPYDNRASSYERKDPSYEKQVPYDKRHHSPYSRIRTSSYGSRSPSRDDPRKRPRTPPEGRRPLSPRENSSPINSLRSEEGALDYERNGKQIPRVDFYQSYRHKSSIRSPSQEIEPPYAPHDSQHTSLVTVQIVDNVVPKPANVESTTQNQEEDPSMDDEPFEPILSDEDICDDLDAPYMDMEYDVNDYCGVDDIIKYYNPYKSEWMQHDFVNKIYLVAKVKRELGKDVLNATFDELVNASTDLFKIHKLLKLAKNRDQKFFFLPFNEIDSSSKEEWVNQCEQLFPLVASLCKDTDIILRILDSANKTHECDEFKEIFDYLLAFVNIGLNFEDALAQQMCTYKIRHIKCGIRLAESLVTHKYNGDVVKTLIKSGMNISLLLVEMYAKEYMALSIRLMILKALNGCLSSKESIEHFMLDLPFPKFSKSSNENKPKNGYQALISIMESNPLARIKFSISALIKKLNMYELLAETYDLVLNFNKSAAERDEAGDAELSESDIEFVVNAFDEILSMYSNQCFHISQPKRFLPVSAQFEINKDCSNEILLEFFDIHHLLDVCLYLLTCPTTCNNIVVVSPIYNLIHELVHSHNGIQFLYRHITSAELLFKILMLPFGQQNIDGFIYPLDTSSYSDLQILGLEMAYRLKSLYYLESIRDLQFGKPDEYELIDRLQSLYCLTFGNIGKTAIPDVIAMDENAESLMEIFENDMKLKNKFDSPSKQRSPAKAYAVDLIVSTVKYSSDVNFLKKYGTRILNIARDHEKFEPSVSALLQDIIPYLKPIENANILNGEDIAECVEILKNSLDFVPSLPGEILTSLRILRHYCISDYENKVSIASESAIEEYVELKYKNNILQLFSLDGVVHICNILDRLTTHFDQPSIHTSFFVSMKGLLLVQTILPCLKLLDDMLARVVKCRGSRFRDMTAAPILLKTYGLVKSFPTGCIGYRTALRASEAVVRALLAYAQPAADDANDGDSIRKGPWTSLCSEVINYTMTAPHTFVHGLLVFSELLPLPLPMQTKITPTERELSDALNERRLWSAHLHALGNDLTDLIQVICMSTYRPVVHMLRRVCVQIADLAPNTATTVAQAAVGAVSRELKAGEPASSSAARVLSFLACLVAHAPVKCAVLYAMTSGGPKAGDIQAALCGVLSLSHASSEHTAAQEFAALALAGFCDAEVTLMSLNDDIENVIVNSLPSKDALASLLEASADCLQSVTRTPAVALSILRAYFVLTEHEYGLLQFKKLATKRKESFGNFFSWLVEGGEETAECLTLYIDFLRILRVEEGEGPIGRRSMLTLPELADLVGYIPPDQEHIAVTLEKTMKEKSTDEDTIANAAFLSTSLLEYSPADLPPPAPPASPPPATPLATPTPLVAQFRSRGAGGPGGVGGAGGGEAAEERLTAAYWLRVPDAPAVVAPVEDDAHDESTIDRQSH